MFAKAVGRLWLGLVLLICLPVEGFAQEPVELEVKFVPVPFPKGHLRVEVTPLRTPGPDGEPFGHSLAAGADVQLIDAAEIGQPTVVWVQVDNGTAVGWVPVTDVVPVRLAVVTGGVRIRLDPAIDADVRGVLKAGTQVEILGQTPKTETLAGRTARWFRVVTDDNVQGWVFGAYLKERTFEPSR